MRIIVVGAGIIGLASASELLRRGHEVTVFDPDPVAGASRAAAGMLAPTTEFAWGQDVLHPLLADAAGRYPAFIAALEGRTGLRTGHRRTATLALGVDAADRETLAELAARRGAAVRRITGSQARELEPALAPAVSGGLLVPDDHQVDPRRVAAALLAELGSRVRLEAVAAVEREAGSERATGVRTASGERADADEVLVAAGLGATRIDGVPPLPLRPVWGDILRLRVPDGIRPLLTHTVRGLVRGSAVYLVPREDGELVLGATVREGGVEGVQAGGVLALLRDAERILPGVAECEIAEVLARARPGSPDAVPLLGRVAPGLVVATGFDRHGVLLTPLAAELGADLIEGRGVAPAVSAAMDPFRFDGTGDATAEGTATGTGTGAACATGAPALSVA
ncbi:MULTISPECIES: glycine oxidase ThiO [unclassified Microbacterium]|uniref:glycine oxidase ThiO n=1 Tax=unclassified Microbacterium TaxID=2609290 RepID=UPI003650CB8D